MIFTGFQKNILTWLARLDIVIQASTMEAGFGLTVVEGMKLGKAVVATESCREIIEHLKTGVLYATGEATTQIQELRRALEMVATDPLLREKLGSSAKDFACQKFSIAAMMDSIEGVYDTL